MMEREQKRRGEEQKDENGDKYWLMPTIKQTCCQKKKNK